MGHNENKDNNSYIKDNKKEKFKVIAKESIEFLRDLLIIIVVVLLVRFFIFENTRVIGPSMEPTLHDGDILMVSKFEYFFTNPERGEVIVFPYKGDPSKHYIKRIIGLPGELIDIRDGEVYINGELLEEDYILSDMETRGDIEFPYIIPSDTYFVMGDNRNNSSDSRYQDVGTIEKDKIIGHAVFRLWPVNQIGIIK
ncbi:MAG TPA: signal peptidase I [Defluviitaleaceae bacterium]|jgi:signal peptidase I|nr:signal peptidase I [Candidatus Epulonipiscium sp.]HOA80351.1 signal peptidase I [Defluviitaleaceae bacterium]